MKKISVKKIVLCGIAALSSLALLLSMGFFCLYMPSLPSAASIAGTTAENAFSMMDFESFLLATDELKFVGVLLGVGAYLMLIVSIAGLAISVLSIFIPNTEKTKKWTTLFTVVNLGVAALYTIFGIIAASSVNAPIKEAAEALSGVTGGAVSDDSLDALLYSSASFWALILQGVTLVAYILCAKLIREPNDQAACAPTENAEKAERADKTENRPAAISYAEKENKIIALLQKYKDIYARGIITVMDFEKKKYVLMFENKHVDLDLESQLVDVLVAYRKIYDEEIVTHDEYEKKKLQILAAK